MKPLATTLALLLVATVAAFVSICTCVFGAMTTGLEGDGWNWQFIPFIALGALSGIVSGILALLLANQKLRDNPTAKTALVLVGPPAISFLVGAAAFPALHAKNERRQADGRARYETQQATMQSYLSQARHDPEIVLRERWLDAWDERRRVLNDNMATGAIPFSEEQLERLYKTWTYGEVFRHPACSAEFLARHFETVAARAEHINHTDLAALVSNPATPLELVMRVAASQTLPVGAVYPARAALKKRDPENPAAAAWEP